MTAEPFEPRRFGTYLLTADLGQDALGRVFRALRTSGERVFARLRILESPEISEDAILDAIEGNGEIHSFLKNPAIARGVHMDAVDGVPFIAWNEPNGRTLDILLSKARLQNQKIPFEHALLIVEKVATALDHAYNTTVEGERTLHGLVWPGFISVSDDGETRLTGFGLGPGFFPSLQKPRFSREVAPYLAPEQHASRQIGKNSDVYSVGVLLFELLVGRLPQSSDPLSDLRAVTQGPAPIPPEVTAVLRTCLSPADSRYQSSGDLRRELGKLLFSGPYSPSTFNLAFFLHNLFAAEIEAENRARAQEASLDLGLIHETPIMAPTLPPAAAVPGRRPVPTPKSASSSATVAPVARSRRPLVLGSALLVAAAVVGTITLISRRTPPQALLVTRVTPRSPEIPRATPTPEPAPSTTGMSAAQFKDEVARRVAQELKRLEVDAKKSRSTNPAPSAPLEPPPTSVPTTVPLEVPTAGSQARPEPTAPSTPLARPSPVAVAAAEPTQASQLETPRPTSAEAETPPKIQKVVKPLYPSFALRSRIKGIVVLRVLVSETGTPLEVEVLKGVGGGLTEAAVTAVKRWIFEPARKDGVPVKAWTTIPIPFEP